MVMCVALAFFSAGNPGVAQAQDPQPRVDTAQRDFDLATSFYQRSVYAQAAELYAQFRSTYPNHEKTPLALFREAECLFQTARTESEKKAKITQAKAYGLFKTLQESHPQGERMNESLLRLGQCAVALGLYEEAVLPLRRLLTRTEAAPELQAPGQFALARAYGGQKKHKEAVAAYDRLRKQFPTSPLAGPATYLQAEAEQSQGNMAGALRLFDILTADDTKLDLSADPTLAAKAWLGRGRILYQDGKYADAAKAYGRISSASPTAVLETRGLYGLAWCRFHVEDYPNARRTADNLLKRSLPKDVESGCLYLLGSGLYHEEKYKECIEPLRRFLALADDDELHKEAWYQLTWAYMLDGQVDEAQKRAQELLQSGVPAGRASDLHYLNGRIQFEAKRWPLAEKAFLEARELRGGQYRDDAAFALAQAQYNQEKFEAAMESFDWFVSHFPNDKRIAAAYRTTADAALKLQRYDEASTRLAKLVDLAPDQDDADQLLYQQALSHYQLGAYEEMAKILDRLRREHPQSQYAPQAQYWMGWVAEQGQDFERAKAAYEAFLQSYSDSEWRWEVARRLAVLWYREGREEKAYELLVQLLTSPEADNLQPEICFWMAMVAERREEFEQILSIMDVLETRAADQPVRERIALTRARTLVTLKRWDEAETTANQALAAWPQTQFQPELLWVRGRARWGQDRLEEAGQDFEAALESLTRSGSQNLSFEVKLHFDTAEVLRAGGKLRAAIRKYQMVAQLFDHQDLSPLAFMRSAQCYEGLEETDRLRRDLKDMIQRYPQHALAGEANAWLQRLGSE